MAKRRQRLYVTERELIKTLAGRDPKPNPSTKRLPPIMIECEQCDQDFAWNQPGDCCPRCTR